MIVDLAKRETPARYLKEALEIYRNEKLDFGGCIIEIGCVRQTLTHDPTDGSTCHSCSDGHTSAWLAQSGFPFYSCDISETHCGIARLAIACYPQSQGIIYCADGIQFLANTPGPVAMLILDAWDADQPESAIKHLEALQTVLLKMARRSLIVVDDTDVVYAGNQQYKSPQAGQYGSKGELAVPYALQQGYSEIMTGRMTVLGRGL